MVNPLPAVLIGGPPHAGKSVLTYNLTQALRRRNVPHYVLRASPDGGGDWSQEMNQNTLHLVRIKGEWTPEFVTRICSDLEQRQLPLLVDVGGRPTDEQTQILDLCTHSILLLRTDEKDNTRRWLDLVGVKGLVPLAQIYSERFGVSTITSNEPVIEGTLTELDRGTQRLQSQLFDALVERISSLFTSVTFEDAVKIHLNTAPVELMVNLNTFAQTWVPNAGWWEPEMIQRLLDEIPANVPLAVYGRGPGWLYGALASHTGMQPFHQFNTRLGWVAPPPLQISALPTPEIRVVTYEHEDVTIMHMNLLKKHLIYSRTEHLPFPPVVTGRGLILSGAVPQWLLTALVRLYNESGVAWIAYHYPPDQALRAVVMTSRSFTYRLGDLVPVPMSILQNGALG